MLDRSEEGRVVSSSIPCPILHLEIEMRAAQGIRWAIRYPILVGLRDKE